MAHYSTIGRREIETLLAAYDIGPLVHADSLGGGQANSSFRIETTAGRFVLSICDEKTARQIDTMAALLDLLERHRFPATRVVPSRSGRPATAFEGKPVLIKRYIEGRVRRELTTDMIAQIGCQLAHLHAIDPPEDIPPAFAYGTDSFQEVIDSPADPVYRRWLADKQTWLVRAVDPDLPRALIHGDLFYDNVLFDGRRLAAILDFEEACRFTRIFDLGMCAVGVACAGGRIVADKVRALVDGYQGRSVLTPPEKRCLQAFVVYGAVATSFWRFRQYNLVWPGHAHALHYQEMNRIADQVQAMSPAEFDSTVFNAS